MMQFTESIPLPPLHPSSSLGLCLDAVAATSAKPSSWPASSKPVGGMMNSASCMEQLLVHCAHAIDRNDASLAHQIFWVLNTIAPPDGDSTQRLASSFLRALLSRASDPASPEQPQPLHRFSPLDLASFVDLTPYHRFGFSAANAAILHAVQGFSVVHIVDLGTAHCMQLPTLIDALAARPEGPPFLRLTVPLPSPHHPAPPLLDLSYDDLGARLVAFARSRNVPMEFRALPSGPTDAFETLIEQLHLERSMVVDGGGIDEALVVNCQMLLHYVPDESDTALPPPMSLRSMLLKKVRTLEPTLVTLVDEDVDLAAGDVIARLRSAFNYLWIPYDAVDTFLPRGSERRRWYEEGVYWKIENVIGREGAGRVERSEPRGRWAQRMRGSGFRTVGFGEEAVAEVKGMLDEHAAGWGLKKEEDHDLVLTWKGHNVVFATAWVPALSA